MGAGTMGRGIAHSMLSKGFPVFLLDVSEDPIASATHDIRSLFNQDMKKGMRVCGVCAGARRIDGARLLPRHVPSCLRW